MFLDHIEFKTVQIKNTKDEKLIIQGIGRKCRLTLLGLEQYNVHTQIMHKNDFVAPLKIDISRAYSSKIIWAAVATKFFSCLNNDAVSGLDPWICQSVCLQSYDCLTVKSVKASINVSNVSCKGCSLL